MRRPQEKWSILVCGGGTNSTHVCRVHLDVRHHLGPVVGLSARICSRTESHSALGPRTTAGDVADSTSVSEFACSLLHRLRDAGMWLLDAFPAALYGPGGAKPSPRTIDHGIDLGEARPEPGLVNPQPQQGPWAGQWSQVALSAPPEPTRG